MSYNINPGVHTYTAIKPFRAWCQKVLPLVYDDSLSYYELLCKLVDYLNKLLNDLTNMGQDITALNQAFQELQAYVNNYFDNLDVQDEINNKLDQMVQDGTLTDVIQQTFGNSKKLKGYDNNCIMVTIGDSYARGTAYESSQGGTVATGQGWPYWLNNLFNYDVRNYASGGAGYTKQGTSGDLAGRNFKELAEYAVSDLGNDVNNVEYVILSGGINDTVSDWEGLQTAVEDCIEYIVQNFKSARILIGSSVLRGSSECATTGDIKKGIMIKNMCTSIGVGYIENSTNFFNGHMKEYDSGDTVHPSVAGYRFMAEKIQSFIDGASVFDDFMDYVGNATGTMAVGDMCTSVSVNPPRVIYERGVYTFKGSVLLSGEYNSAQRIVTGIPVPPANYNIPGQFPAILYNPTDRVFIGITVYDFVANPDNVHYDIRLQRMYNAENSLFNLPIPDGTRVYLCDACYNSVF